MSLRARIVLAGLLVTGAASATPRDEARAAYDRGLEARKRGDLKRASEELALADALVPDPHALRAALDAAVEADDAALGEELVARAQREPAAPDLAASVTAAHLKFNGRAGRLRALCPSSHNRPCYAKLDGRSIDTNVPVWTTTGPHVVTFTIGGVPQTKNADVTPDALADVVPVTKGQQVHAGDVPPAAGTREGLPPLVTYAGIGLGVGLLAATTFLAVDTKNTHTAFDDAGCSVGGNPGCQDVRDDGVHRQTLTNVFLVSTFVVAAATAVVALAFTDWKPRAGVTF